MLGVAAACVAVWLTVCSATAMPQYIFCLHGINVSQAVAKPGDKVVFYYMQAPAFEVRAQAWWRVRLNGVPG
jgi:hypothetical protein